MQSVGKITRQFGTRLAEFASTNANWMVHQKTKLKQSVLALVKKTYAISLFLFQLAAPGNLEQQGYGFIGLGLLL